MATNPKGLDPGASRPDDRMGEITEASTTIWRAVAPRTFEAPAFGSFVKTSDGSRTIYGVVAHVQHSSIDPSRKAIPLGRTWDELRREQPQVLELLTTEFEALCVAFAEEAREICAFLPPLPPRVHDFVEACTPEEVVELTEDLGFVRTLGASGVPVVAELIAASIREAAAHRSDERAFSIRAGREVADLFRGDYELASSIIRRIRTPEPRPSVHR